MTRPASHHLFERYGVELEYMIVDADSLDVLPVTDEVLKAVAGRYTNDVAQGPVTWSNELVLHVIELKCTDPLTSLSGVHRMYQDNVRHINRLLQRWNARLMPTAMHPWMDPFVHTRLWPHDNNEIYDAFNAIFDCRGHGWSNLQSVHLNLPFAGEEEFARLHAAVRFLIPMMPALAASSPILELRATGVADNRMDVYRSNCARIPSVTGLVVPEPVYSTEAYRREILERMYRDIAPHDPNGTLQDEWLNARGAIARFERDTIEVRVLDVQECPLADLAVVSLVATALKQLCDERWLTLEQQQAWSTDDLHRLLLATIHSAERAEVVDADYAHVFGLGSGVTAGDVWRRVLDGCSDDLGALNGGVTDALDVIMSRGTLSTRILRSLNGDLRKETVARVYGNLAECLERGEMFLA